jgi:hypothetical protein
MFFSFGAVSYIWFILRHTQKLLFVDLLISSRKGKKESKKNKKIKNINYPKTSEYLKTRKNLPLLDYIEIMTSTFTIKCNYSDFNYINRDDILETNLRAGFEYTKT